jgi:hypothetical protein
MMLLRPAIPAPVNGIDFSGVASDQVVLILYVEADCGFMIGLSNGCAGADLETGLPFLLITSHPVSLP